MSVLDQVAQMRRAGKSDEEIISDLRSQNPKISPREISEALNHAQIKNAVSDAYSEGSENFNDLQVPSPQGPQPPATDQSNNFEQGTYNPSQPQNYDSGYGQQNYGSQPYGNQSQQYNPDQYAPQQEYYQPQSQDYGQGYDQQGYAPSTGSDTMVEISEQVFEDKIRNIMKKIDSFEEFKALAQTKLEHLGDRLKRIESVMDKLQAAILEKIGSYGSDLGSIKKEMSMMQDSFSKTLNPLLDIAEGKHVKHESEPSHAKKEKTEKKSRPSKK